MISTIIQSGSSYAPTIAIGLGVGGLVVAAALARRRSRRRTYIDRRATLTHPIVTMICDDCRQPQQTQRIPSTPSTTTASTQEPTMSAMQSTQSMNTNAIPAGAMVPPPMTAAAFRSAFDTMAHSTPALQRYFGDYVPSLFAFHRGDASAPRLIVLHGEPGSGKSHLATMLAKLLGTAHVAQHSVGSLKSDKVGGTGKNIVDCYDTALRHQQSIVIVDEADGIFPSRSNGRSDSVCCEAVNALLPWLDGSKPTTGRVLTIFTANSADFDSAILSRADMVISFKRPSDDEMANIIAAMLKKYGMQGPDMCAWIANTTEGLSIRDIELVIRWYRQQTIAQTPRSQMGEDYVRFVDSLRSAASDGFRAIPLASIALTETTRAALNDAILPIQQRPFLRIMNVRLPTRPILLVGPPGTGKTMIAQAIATEIRGRFIEASAAALKGNYVGETPKRIRTLFASARARSPAVMFIDEIDCLANSRNGESSIICKETLQGLLTELDGLRSSDDHQPLVIAATNCLDVLDPALVSRFTVITVDLPTTADRAMIAQSVARECGLSDQDIRVMLPQIVRMTTGKSGRDVRHMVERTIARWATRCVQRGRQLPIIDADIEPMTPLAQDAA